MDQNPYSLLCRISALSDLIRSEQIRGHICKQLLAHRNEKTLDDSAVPGSRHGATRRDTLSASGRGGHEALPRRDRRRHRRLRVRSTTWQSYKGSAAAHASPRLIDPPRRPISPHGRAFIFLFACSPGRAWALAARVPLTLTACSRYLPHSLAASWPGTNLVPLRKGRFPRARFDPFVRPMPRPACTASTIRKTSANLVVYSYLKPLSS